jgi:uracil-DNA glycosylase family 4
VLLCVGAWLSREIELLRPKIIVTLGAQPLWYVRAQTGITNRHGTWHWLENYECWSYATFHPSYVIRCMRDPAKKHIPDWFEQDFAKLAETWEEVVKKKTENGD